MYMHLKQAAEYQAPVSGAARTENQRAAQQALLAAAPEMRLLAAERLEHFCTAVEALTRCELSQMNLPTLRSDAPGPTWPCRDAAFVPVQPVHPLF